MAGFGDAFATMDEERAIRTPDTKQDTQVARLSAAAAAATLGVHERTIRRAIARGDLPAVKHAGVYQIASADLARFRNHRTQVDSVRPSRAEPVHDLRRFPVGPPVIHPRPLPTPLTSLIRRERETAAIVQLVQQTDVRLVTVIGPGGVGKTRLVLAAAAADTLGDAFPDGIAFVPLADVRDNEVVPSAIAQALRIKVPVHRHPLNHLSSVLATRRILLILDNFEHLPDAALLLAELLLACPMIAALVTSRAILNVSGEHHLPVAPLAVPRNDDYSTVEASPAVQLFAARAAAVVPGFTLTPSNAADVAFICRQLDGLPLAIELAAARVRLFPPASLRQRLGDLDFLANGPADQPPRLRSLREAITWSYALLPTAAQRLFRRLAVFDSPVPLEAVAAVAHVGNESLTTIEAEVSALVDQSLLHTTASPTNAPLYRMLDTIRVFALEHLRASGDEHDVRSAHAAYVGSIAAHCEMAMASSGSLDTAVALDQAEAMLPEFRVAVPWLIAAGHHTQALALAFGYRHIWWNRNHVAEGRVWTERILAATPPIVDRDRCLVVLWAAILAAAQGDANAAQIHVREGLNLAHSLGDRAVLAHAYRHAGQVAGYRDDDLAAVDFHRQAVLLDSHPETPRGGPLTLCEYGSALVRVHRLDDAEAVLEIGIAVARERKAHLVHSLDLLALGTVNRLWGRLPEAQVRYADAFSLASATNDRSLQAEGLVGMAGVALAAGDAWRAAGWLGTADALRELTGRGRYRNQHQYREVVDGTRRVLGERHYHDTWTAGLVIPAEVAIAEALLPVQHMTGRGRVAVPYGLTPRERDVLRLMIKGLTDKEIATELSVSVNTISNGHVRHILAKLGAKNRADAAVRAVRERLV